MKKLIVIIGFLGLIIISCSKNHEKFPGYYESQKLFNHQLVLTDSLVYNYNSNNKTMISKISWVTFRDNNIFVADKEEKCIYVFDKELKKMIKKIGRKGRGGGEFISTPIIIEGTKQLEVIEDRTKTVKIYDDNYEYVTSKSLSLEHYYNNHEVARFINGKYFISSGYLVNWDDYFGQHKSTVVFNKDFTVFKEILDWDPIYYDPELTGFAQNNIAVLCTSEIDGEFYLLQVANNIIYKINEKYEPIFSFGVKPLKFKKPIKGITWQETQRSFDAMAEFLAKHTRFYNLRVDKVTKQVFLEYGNPTVENFKHRDLIGSDRYLQVFDVDYNCIFDGKIDGMFLFVEDGEIYVLSDENPNYIKILKYKLVKG